MGSRSRRCNPSRFSLLQLIYGIQNNRSPRQQWDYTAAVGFLKNHATPSSQIVGGAELAFQLGFDAHLIDDPRLGYYSGKRPDFIVANSLYHGWFKRSQTRYPEIYNHIQRVLSTSYQGRSFITLPTPFISASLTDRDDALHVPVATEILDNSTVCDGVAR